jgi:hypothetical protein
VKYVVESWCHWTFRIGGYESFQSWTTRAGVLHFLEVSGYDTRMCETFVRHSRWCVPETPMCEPA